MINSVFEDGYSWVEIPDELWYNSTQMDYFEGIPIYTKKPYQPIVINTHDTD